MSGLAKRNPFLENPVEEIISNYTKTGLKEERCSKNTAITVITQLKKPSTPSAPPAPNKLAVAEVAEDAGAPQDKGTFQANHAEDAKIC